MSIPVLIIPVLNRFDLLHKALESIDYPIDNILIINNSGKSYNTEDLPRKFSHLNIRSLDMPSNQGIAGSWNLGIKCYPHAPYWLISSADTSFLPGSLEKFANLSSETVFVKSDAQYSCFSIGEEIVRIVGLFDEYIYPAYFEDNDYNDRMILSGLESRILCPGIGVDDSGGSQTIKSDRRFEEKNHETFVRNQDYYHAKKSSGNYTLRGWDLNRRRLNEWL